MRVSRETTGRERNGRCRKGHIRALPTLEQARRHLNLFSPVCKKLQSWQWKLEREQQAPVSQLSRCHCVVCRDLWVKRAECNLALEWAQKSRFCLRTLSKCISPRTCWLTDMGESHRESVPTLLLQPPLGQQGQRNTEKWIPQSSVLHSVAFSHAKIEGGMLKLFNLEKAKQLFGIRLSLNKLFSEPNCIWLKLRVLYLRLLAF